MCIGNINKIKTLFIKNIKFYGKQVLLLQNAYLIDN